MPLAILLLVMAGILVPRPGHTQGAWRQDRFVIGTWTDPTIDPSRPVITQRAMATARAGHFNLLTGTHHHFGGWRTVSPPDTADLSPAAAAGMGVALTHNSFYGTASTPAANVPAFDSTLTPYVFGPPRSASLPAEAKDALEGWCLWDEPPYDSTGAARVSEFLKNWVAASHREDLQRADGRSRFTWINFFNGCGGGYGCYESYLRKYLSDPDPLRRADVASVTLFPFTGSTTAPLLHNYFYWLRVMRDVMEDRPFWVVSMASEAAAGTGFSRPDENQFRFMAFAPVAAGARGVVWFTYNFDDGYGAKLGQRGLPTLPGPMLADKTRQPAYLEVRALTVNLRGNERAVYNLLIELQRPVKGELRDRYLAVEAFSFSKPDLYEPADDLVSVTLTVVAYKVNSDGFVPGGKKKEAETTTTTSGSGRFR